MMKTKHKVSFGLACYCTAVLLVCAILLVGVAVSNPLADNLLAEETDGVVVMLGFMTLGMLSYILLGVMVVGCLHGLMAMILFSAVLFVKEKPVIIRNLSVALTSFCGVSLLCLIGFLFLA